MRILVLRPVDDAERSAKAITARGHEPIVAPLFAVEGTSEAAPDGSFDAVVLASGNAVPFLAQARPEWRGLPVFTVGARTAAKARAAGLTDARSADGDRNDLIELIRSNMASPAKLLLVLGRDRREDLPQRLGEAGYEVTVWTAYAAKALAALPDAAIEPLRAGTVDAVLHYSARGAQTYIGLARDADLEDEALTPTHVALSADVATPLITAGAGTVLVAEFPEEAAMLAALDQVSDRHAPRQETDGDGTAPESAPLAADVETHMEAVLPTEALPREFSPPDSTASPPAEPAHQPAATPVQTGRSPLPWQALAVAGLVGGAVGAGLVMLALNRSAPAVDPAEFAQLRSRIEALQSSATALDRKAAAATEAASKAGAEAQANATRLGELATAPRSQGADPAALAGVTALAEKAQAAANALGQRLDQTAARIGSVETLARSAAAPSTQALAAARIVLAERVRAAIASGKPFASDVAALAKGEAAPEQLAALNAVAAQGAPTQSALLAQFRAQRAVFARELTPADASWQDRLLGLASRIVTIRPVGDTGADDPATLLIRFENALAGGNIVAAAGLWQQLPEPARRASAVFGDNLRKRAAADAAIAKIAQDAVAALGAAG